MEKHFQPLARLELQTLRKAPLWAGLAVHMCCDGSKDTSNERSVHTAVRTRYRQDTTRPTANLSLSQGPPGACCIPRTLSTLPRPLANTPCAAPVGNQAGLWSPIQWF